MDITKEIWGKLDNYTLAQPPPGVVANLKHPTWHGQGVVITTCIGIPIMLVMTTIRIYSKCYLTGKWVMDDSIFLVSLTSALSLISLQVAVICGGGFGYHAWEVKLGAFTKPVLLRTYILQIITPLFTWLLKLAVFSLLFHTFRPLHYVRRLVYIGVAVSGIYSIASAIVNGIACGPRGGTDRESYLAALSSNRCGDPSGTVELFSILSGVVNLIVDLYLLIIPFRAISNLNLPRKRKAGVFLIFLTGGCACVMSILVLYYRTQGYSHDSQFSSSWNHDITYQIVSILTASTIEYTVGILIPCMIPSVKVLKSVSGKATSYLGSKFTSFRRTKSNGNSMKAERELKTNWHGIFQERTFSVEESLPELYNR